MFKIKVENFRHRVTLWKQELKEHKGVIFLSVCLFIIANVINHIAGTYADRIAYVSVTDLMLDILPPMDLSFIFVYGYIVILVTLFAYPLFFNVRKLHSTIGQFSLLVLIRSFFIILTHLKAPFDAVRGNLPLIYSVFSFKNDLFFSGHTSIAFLGFLLFRKEKIGIFFLIASFAMAFIVLAMHLHYSIDVFAAFFITYGCYKIGNFVFDKINYNPK